MEEKLAQFAEEREGVTPPTTNIPISPISAPPIGFVKIILDELPSKGLFYPKNTEILIRAAEVAEIKHWSALDTNDFRSIDESINFVLQNCVTVKINNSIGSWKDIKEFDRLFLIFAIRELTFKDGENKLYLPGDDKVEIKKDMMKYFDLDETLMKYYSEDERCFIFKNHKKEGEELKLYFPSIGISSFIKNFIEDSKVNGKKVDDDFMKFAPFIFKDFRNLDEIKFRETIIDSNGWSLYKWSVLGQFVDKVLQNVNPRVIYTKGGEEVSAPLNFQGGFKSIFLISDIFI